MEPFGQRDIAGLFGEGGVAGFLQAHWGRGPWHGHGDPGRLRAMFSPEAFWDLVARPAGAPRVKARYTTRDGAERDLHDVPGRLAQGLLDAGMTLCASQLDASAPGLAAFTRAARTVLGFAGGAAVNLYASPDGRGFGWHYDCEHVLVFQVDGAKRWESSVHPATPWPPVFLPSDAALDPTVDPRVAALGTVVAPPPDGVRDLADTVTLTPGDVLYLPPGAWHRTAAQDRSVSLTLSLHPLSFARALRACATAAEGASPAWRAEALPSGWAPLRAGAYGQSSGALPSDIADPLAAWLTEARSWLAALDPVALVHGARSVLRPPGPFDRGGESLHTAFRGQRFPSPGQSVTRGAMLRAALVGEAVGRVAWRQDLSPVAWPAGDGDPSAGAAEVLAARLTEARAWLAALGPEDLAGPLRAALARQGDGGWWDAALAHL